MTHSKTIVIADSITQDFVGGGEHEQVKVHVGRPEAQRLLGKDGKGPLPVFLRQAVKAQATGASLGMINIRDVHDPNDPAQIPELLRHGNHNLIDTPGVEVVSSIANIFAEGDVVDLPVTALSVPIMDLRKAVMEALGIDILSAKLKKENVKIVVTGTHSNIRVFDTADTFRHKLGFPNVIVSPHLAASNDRGLHDTTFMQWFPDKLIRVAQSVAEAATLVGIQPPSSELISWRETCQIGSEEIKAKLNPDQLAIIETMFMDRDSVDLKKLSGGYSGSLLFVANSKKGGAGAAPVVLKIDKHIQIKRETDGYTMVKPYLGNHVPAFGKPVSMGEYTGVQMDLASLKGSPLTYQKLYEESGDSTAHLEVLGEVIDILNTSLYVNTKGEDEFAVCEKLGLLPANQKVWLYQNIEHIAGGADDDVLDLGHGVKVKNPKDGFAAMVTYEKPRKVRTALSHRDLNFANVVLDEKENIWFIDWTHAGRDLVEIDFAKMENDLKFVMTKCFSEQDMPQLKLFEQLILASVELPDIDTLSAEYEFVKTDPRFRKIYEVLSVLRGKYVEAREGQPDVDLYKTALMKYSIHTLSFDKRRGRGECDLPALKYALISTSLLVEALSKQYETDRE